jgi:agmatine deiminase
MKKTIAYFIIAVITLQFGHVNAQNTNGLPNNGLTHKMSESEKLFMNQVAKETFSTTLPPSGPIRNIAEFEPAEAVIIAYLNGFGLPYSVIKDLSNTGKVKILAKSSDQATITSNLNSNSVNTANCSFITTTAIDSWWTRDYTGWFIADSSSNVAVVDFTYNRNRPNDDVATALEASSLSVPLYGMALTHTGGNYMCDGYNNAISTVLVTEENTSLTETQIKQKASDYLGITNYMIVADAQGQYIEHIDCWGKYLAPDKILIDSVPSSDTRYSNYEAAAAYFAGTDCAYGYKYKVTRVLIAGSSETSAAEPYSNSFIFNNRVFVPIKGGTSAAHDTAALVAYRKAMPGYIVKGYTASSGAAWYGTDALHCRTHEIADREMLYVEHFPLHDTVFSTTGYQIDAKVISYAGRNIEAGYPKIIYRVNQGQWDSIPMTFVSNHNYTGVIPNQIAGDSIYYYIKAKDVLAKFAYHPFIGKPDPHKFVAGSVSTGIASLTKESGLVFYAYPNPNNGKFSLYLKSGKAEEASVQIFNTTGSLVYMRSLNLESGVNINKIDLKAVSQGVYFIEIKTSSELITKQLIVQ